MEKALALALVAMTFIAVIGWTTLVMVVRDYRRELKVEDS